MKRRGKAPSGAPGESASGETASGETRRTFIDLDENGDLVDPRTGKAVGAAAVPGFLERHLYVPPQVTDIVVFVHGWRNSPADAAASGDRLAALLETRFAERGGLYPAIRAWDCHYVIVRWPSMSSALPRGYARIRDRAHHMSTSGRAGDVIAQLLGYLNQSRGLPSGPAVLRTRPGQYLHCVGHSFGGRFIVQAVIEVGATRPAVLGWNRADPRYPYAVDTLLVFQMAASPDIFSSSQRFARILSDSPVNGPLVLTRSAADRATGLWHRLAEGVPGIGTVGVSQPAGEVSSITLHPVAEPYARDEFPTRIVNVDAGSRFRRGRLLPQGAHSDIWYPESAHLLLSLAALAR